MLSKFGGMLKYTLCLLLAVNSFQVAYASCKSQYPQAVTEDYNSSVILRSRTVYSEMVGQFFYYYFNSKANVPFTISFNQSSAQTLLYASRASVTLYPILENNEGYSDKPITIRPTKSECYAIGVRSLQVGTVRLQIINSDSSLPTQVSQNNTCTQLYRGNTVRPRFLFGYSGSFELSPLILPFGEGRVVFSVYYDAKAGEKFTVNTARIAGGTGYPDIYISRAVVSQTPGYGSNVAEFTELTGQSFKSLTIVPSADECYAFDFAGQSSTFALSVISGEPTAAPTTAPVVTTAPAPAPTTTQSTTPIGTSTAAPTGNAGTTAAPITTGCPSIPELPTNHPFLTLTPAPELSTTAVAAADESDDKSSGKDKRLTFILGFLSGGVSVALVAILVSVFVSRRQRYGKLKGSVPLKETGETEFSASGKP